MHSIQFQEFHVAIDAAQSLPFNCYGSDHCCSASNKCDMNYGDCDHDDQCSSHALVCGRDNCLSLGLPNRDGGLWDPTDDCCERRCTPDHPCPQGDGDCDTDSDCANPTWQQCTNDACLNSNYFPVAQYPNNTAAK